MSLCNPLETEEMVWLMDEGKRGAGIGALLLLGVTLLAYLPALTGGFVWDDDAYVTNNRTLVEPGGLGRIWFEPGATTQYYPLVHTSFWIESRLWGFGPFGYHLVNVLLHGLNGGLLFLLLRRLGVPGAWFGAALFALHPVHVESVAWITERKNVLSGFFYLASLLAWFRFAPAGEEKRGPSRMYALSLLLFAAALLSKSVTASLPAAVLLLRWWKGGRLRARDAAPLLPFFLLGIASGLGTIWIERNLLGAEGAEWGLSLPGRVLLAGRALLFYASKLVWPADLAFFYPRWEIDPGSFAPWLFPLASAAVFAHLVLARKKTGRGPLAAFLFFAGTLFPALGFVNVYPFRFSYVADHFQYLASIGPITLFAAVAASRVGRLGPDLGRRMAGAGGFLLFFFLILTWRQCGDYHDLETLWRSTIEKNPSAWAARVNLGEMLDRSGRTEEAIEQYEKALESRPEYDKALNNLGLALERKGDIEGAVRRYEGAVRSNPSSAGARSNLGLALLNLGRTEEAIRRLEEALRLRPRAPELHTNLAVALARAGRREEAERGFREAVRLAPGDPESLLRLGLFLRQAGEAREAEECFRGVLELRPGHEGALRALGE